MSKKIWLSAPHLSGEEQKYVNDAFETNWIAPSGPNLDAFEKEIQNYLGGKKEVVALNSGTASIHLALVLLGINKGDEVLCQSLTFAATANPIIYQGANPVFVDSEEDTWNICPILLEKAIKKRIAKGNKPKAIIAVHLYGMPFKVNEIQEISKKYHIPLIEDAASALGSEVNGEKCGIFGDYGIISFNGNKIITTSAGGILITKNKELKEKTVFLATQAKDDATHYEHSHLGYNYRMSNVLAGIGRGQLAVLNNRVNARRINFEFYKKELKNYDIKFLKEPKGFKSNRWLTCMIANSFEEKEKIRMTLLQNNIESRPIWKPMHQQPVFKNNISYLNGVSDNLFEKGLCLPSGSNLDENQLIKITSLIKKSLEK
jgi:dTDP-4-amino-4,6-dideoxygalactose transaminase